MMTGQTGRILAVDWGEKRIGLAISDPTRTISLPLDVIDHISRERDAERIIQIAEEMEATQIIVGVSYDDDYHLTPTGRSAERLASLIQQISIIPLETLDEGFSTRDAKITAINANLPMKKRKGHLDSLAAAIILDHYLEKNKNA